MAAARPTLPYSHAFPRSTLALTRIARIEALFARLRILARARSRRGAT